MSPSRALGEGGQQQITYLTKLEISTSSKWEHCCFVTLNRLVKPCSDRVDRSWDAHNSALTGWSGTRALTSLGEMIEQIQRIIGNAKRNPLSHVTHLLNVDLVGNSGRNVWPVRGAKENSEVMRRQCFTETVLNWLLLLVHCFHDKY